MSKMPRPDMSALAGVGDCIEAQVWAHSPGSRGLGICACGTAGVEMEMTATRTGLETVVKSRYRHNFYIEPLIVFEPDAVAVAGGMLLGPGLHRAIERARFVEHECWNGLLVGGYEQTSTVE